MNASHETPAAPAWHRRIANAVVTAHKRVWYPRGAPTGRIWTPQMTAAILAGLALVALAALTDAAATRFVRASGSPLIEWMAYLTDAGRSQWYLAPAAAVFIAAALGDWRRGGFTRRARVALIFGQAGFAFAAVALSGIAVNIFKLLVGRARPNLFEQAGAFHFAPLTPGYDYASFPSGHSTTVGSVVAILILWCPRLWLPFTILGVFFAATRVAAHAHYPSDAVAGLLLGGIVTVVLARFLATRRVLFRLREGSMFPFMIRRGSQK